MHQIAVEGCLHGELDAVYGLLLERERREGVKIDLLLCCGDFQVRVWGEGLEEGRDRGCHKESLMWSTVRCSYLCWSVHH